MDVLVTSAHSEIGRQVTEAFQSAGHRVVAAVWDPADPSGLKAAGDALGGHLDAVIHIPAPGISISDPRGFTVADTAEVWRSAFERTVVSAVVAAHTAGDQLRSGGSFVAVAGEASGGEASGGEAAGDEGQREAAVKAALAAWTATAAVPFGTRGITVNTVACGRAAEPGYDGLTAVAPAAAAQIARLALFLPTPAARHTTGQTLHVGRGPAAQFD